MGPHISNWTRVLQQFPIFSSTVMVRWNWWLIVPKTIKGFLSLVFRFLPAAKMKLTVSHFRFVRRTYCRFDCTWALGAIGGRRVSRRDFSNFWLLFCFITFRFFEALSNVPSRWRLDDETSGRFSVPIKAFSNQTCLSRFAMLEGRTKHNSSFACLDV